jgi:hypothetical protein
VDVIGDLRRFGGDFVVRGGLGFGGHVNSPYW